MAAQLPPQWPSSRGDTLLHGRPEAATVIGREASDADETDDEEYFTVQRVRTYSIFEDSPGDYTRPAVHVEAQPPSPLRLRRCWAGEADGAKLGRGVTAKIKVRNTFVHFSDDSDVEGERSSGPGSAMSRRARTIRTVPARLMQGALLPDGPDEEPVSPAAPAEAGALQTPTIAAEAASAAKKAASAAAAVAALTASMGSRRGLAAASAKESPLSDPPLSDPRSAEAPSPEPRHEEQGSTPKARRVEQAEEKCEPRLRVSVRNTFLHFDTEDEGAEQSPNFHRRTGRRTKTGPPRAFVFDDISDDSDEAAIASTAGAATEPCGAAGAQEQRQARAPAAAAPPAQRQAVQPGQPVQAQRAGQPLEIETEAQRLSLPLEIRTAAVSAKPLAARIAVKRSTSDRTTVVLKNLPLNYRRSMLLRMLDSEGFAGDYDYVYLPMDFKTRAGFGYAFINLVDASVVPRFWDAFDGYSRWLFPCSKVCRVSWSVPHQGLKDHIKRYRNSPLMHQSVPDEYKPALFAGGVRVAFPPPTKELFAPAPSQRAAKGVAKGSRQA